jgi:hypothetical protein
MQESTTHNAMRVLPSSRTSALANSGSTTDLALRSVNIALTTTGN